MLCFSLTDSIDFFFQFLNLLILALILLLYSPVFIDLFCFSISHFLNSVQFSSVAQLRLTLCDPMNRSTPGLSVHHHLLEFTQTHVHRVLMPSSHLILCHPLLLLPTIPPSIRVFSNESTLRMRWPKYWSFSFSIIPSWE